MTLFLNKMTKTYSDEDEFRFKKYLIWVAEQSQLCISYMYAKLTVIHRDKDIYCRCVEHSKECQAIFLMIMIEPTVTCLL